MDANASGKTRRDWLAFDCSEMTLALTPLVVMTVIFLIGETFQRCVKLRHDLEGLV